MHCRALMLLLKFPVPNTPNRRIGNPDQQRMLNTEEG
jgi:hypothetical protein